MSTVALIGADGAGKSTIGRKLEEMLPARVKYIYMGINPASSNIALPTTRLMVRLKRALGKPTDMPGPPDPDRARPLPKGIVKRAAAGLKAGFRLANLLCEEWFRQVAAWSYQRRGYLVVFDRHFFFDYYAHDVSGESGRLPLARHIHGFVLDRMYPRPDLVILLDAPAEVLFARKAEGTLERVERRRQEYFCVRGEVRRFEIVDASRPADDVAREVAALIRRSFFPMEHMKHESSRTAAER